MLPPLRLPLWTLALAIVGTGRVAAADELLADAREATPRSVEVVIALDDPTGLVVGQRVTCYVVAPP